MKTSILAITLLAPILAFAGQGKEGGTPIRVRQNINEAALKTVHNNIRYMLESNVVKKRAKYILKYTSTYQWKKLGLEFSASEMINDINQSEYYLADKSKGESCVDKYGKEKFATAKSNDLGGRVCFDLSKVYERGHLVSYEELLAIVFHEHLHHFGLEDIDHEIGTKLSQLGNYLPMNIIHGSCRMNLTGGMDSFNHRLYADDFGSSDFQNTDEWYLQDYKQKSKTVIERIYEYSGCEKSDLKLNLKCQRIFETRVGQIKTSDFICKAQTDQGFMYLTQDMLGFINVSFSRWD